MFMYFLKTELVKAMALLIILLSVLVPRLSKSNDAPPDSVVKVTFR